jgi:TonB family protein
MGGEGGGLAASLAGGLGNSKLDAAFNNSDGGVTGATAGMRKEFEGQPVAVKSGQAGYKGLGKGVGGGRIATKKTKAASKEASGGEVKIRGRARVGSLGSGKGGQIDKKAVSRVLRRRSGAVKRCYEKALKRNEGVNGKLVVKFQIGSAGRITRIKVVKNGTGDSGVASCITSAMKGWRFPIPEGGPVTFSFPFILSKG